jgi:hypothetical protein
MSNRRAAWQKGLNQRSARDSLLLSDRAWGGPLGNAEAGSGGTAQLQAETASSTSRAIVAPGVHLAIGGFTARGA